MRIDIEEVGLDSAGHLFVKPPASGDFAFIWRDASGVRWNEEIHALVAYQPERWEHVKLFQQIVSAVKSEYGRSLQLTAETKWSNLSPELHAQLASAL